MNIQTSVEQMNIVVVGHVDHGKSTVIGRLMADTKSLPEGKLDQVKGYCQKNARPFEYAFLLDALKDEQSQGITIDSARCFFKTDRRHYIIIDAPGHIEFLKNMITGAARAEAAILIIDAQEGIQENSRRHAYLLSMLGLNQIIVCVNKMDLIDYSESHFTQIKKDYLQFLGQLNITPKATIPMSAREGENMIKNSSLMPWYQDKPLLTMIDDFKKEKDKEKKPFRFPLQDIYKFTASGDNRRLFAGRVETGSIQKDDSVLFLPSGKTSTIQSISGFQVSMTDRAFAGQSTGFLLKEQIYVRPGEIMCKTNDLLPETASCFLANVFWLGNDPLIMGKTYRLKLHTVSTSVELIKIKHILDSSTLGLTYDKKEIARHDVAQCIFKTSRPIAFDLIQNMASTSRFVLIDSYEITGGGIILKSLKDIGSDDHKKDSVLAKSSVYFHSQLSTQKREELFAHRSGLILLTGNTKELKLFAQTLEESLFLRKFKTDSLGVLQRIDNSISLKKHDHKDILDIFSQTALTLTRAGLIFIASIPEIDDEDFIGLFDKLILIPMFVIENGESYLSPKYITHKVSENVDFQKEISLVTQKIQNFFDISTHSSQSDE